MPSYALPHCGAPQPVWPAQARLGEGLCWSAAQQALYWVDIHGQQLMRLHLPTGERTSWPFEETISAVAERSAGPGLIVALRHRIALFDPASGALRTLHEVEPHLPGNRFNDGKCDAQGRFWAGSMDFACEAPTGALYRYDPDGQCTRHDEGFVVTNGPTWALDAGRLCLYFNDTLSGSTYRYDCDSTTGTLSNKQLWNRFEPGDGLPDGMTTDALGRVWIAHWGSACVTCHNPVTAEELGRVMLPVSQVTTCTFGGPDLRTLFISTARTGLTPEQLAAEPLAGGLFAVSVDAPGLPANLFGG